MMKEDDVRTWLVGYLAELLEVGAETIVPGHEFRDYGLDSMDAVVVGGALEERFDVEVDATLFLRNRSIDELIADLRRSRLLE
jgi:acyl carrier protein